MNKVMLIGNVGADPVVRFMPDGTTKVAQVRLATTKRGYTKQNGQQVPDKTTWHTLIMWRKLADVVEQYVRKGDKLYVEGEYESREYNDRANPDVKHTVYEVNVSNLELLTPKNTPSAAPAPMAPPAAPGYGGQYAQQGQYAPTAPAPAAPAPAPMPPHYATPQQGAIPFQQQVAGQPQAQQGAPVQAAQQEWGDNSDLPF